MTAASEAGVHADRSQTTILDLHGVGMRYGSGEEVLRDIGLSINAGSFHYLVGPSGAGKTSLLRVMSLSVPISRGKLVVFGQDASQLDRNALGRVRRRIGVVFQECRLLDHLSVFDNVALPLRIGGADEERIAAHVSQMLAWLGLADLMEAKPTRLSTGQRQLVAIARAVVTRPDLLLADEPTSAVDPARVERLMYLFTELPKLGTAVVLATHSRELLRRWPFPVLRMEGGRLAPPANWTCMAAE